MTGNKAAGVGRITPFVGREREMASLESMLEQVVSSGGGHVALIAGEPGIGKSRLLAEVVGRAAAQGWIVLTGRAYESGGTPPYLPFSEMLQAYVAASSAANLATQLGRSAAEVAFLVPGLLERVPGLDSKAPAERGERCWLFDGVADFLLNIARAGGPGLLLALEDLHWADEATVRLLEHLGRRLPEAPLLVVGTFRTVDADRSQSFNEVVVSLQRERLIERIDVRPLDMEEAEGLISELVASPPARALVEAIHHRTGGNPFFIEELVRHLPVEGRDVTSAAAATGLDIPESVRQVIGVRLSRLQSESARVLQIASLLGDPFSFEALAAASDSGLPRLLDALDEASAGGFVRAKNATDYVFSHALVRETIQASLNAPRRAMLHAQVAEKLEAFYAPNAAAHAGELANHLLLGGMRGDLEKAVGYALQAADRAASQLAFGGRAALSRDGTRGPRAV